MCKRIVIASILFFTCAVFSAHAALTPGTYYVNFSSGDDGNAGNSTGTAWQHLHYAILEINGGSPGTYILYVSGETYNPSIEGMYGSDPLIIDQDNVTVIGAGTGTTIIDGQFDMTWEEGFIIQRLNTTIKNLTITNFSSDGIQIDSGADSSTIENCEIYANTEKGIHIVNGSGADNNTIRDCEIYSNADGIWLGTANNIVETCVVHSNSAYGIDIPSAGSNNKIQNNYEIYHNAFAGIILVNTSGNEIYNNTIYDNAMAGDSGIYLESVYDNNLVHDNTIYWSGDGSYIQIEGIHILEGGSGNQIYQNDIYGHTDMGGKGIYVADTSPQIMKNEIHDNEVGIWIEADAVESSPAIENNLIYNTLYDPVAIFANNADANPTIYHNTMDVTESCFIYVYADVGSASPIIKYNIFNNSLYDGICNDLATPVSDYNNFWEIDGETHVDMSPGDHDIFENPLFGSYSLQADSPCIDAIPTTEPDPITDDFEGATRPQGAGFDMGAYEATYAEAGEYTLTVTITPDGGGYVVDDGDGIDCPLESCSGTYIAGTEPVFTAIPEAGYTFESWEGDVTGTDNPLTVTMDSDKDITAAFTANVGNSQADTPTVVSPADGATVTGTQVTLEAGAFSDPEGDDHYRTYWWVKESGSVYGREDYDESFTAEPTEGDLTRHTVSGLISGMQYVWQVGYTDAGSGITSWSAEYSFTVGTSAADSSVSVTAGTGTEDYRMVSFVQWPDDPSGKETFGPADTTRFRIGSYDPDFGSGGYREYGDDFEIFPGRSYWLLARNGLNPTIEGVKVSTTTDIDIALYYNTATANGWNMIGCPNEADYNWNDIEVVEYDDDGNIVSGPTAVADLNDANDVIDKGLWRWDSGSYASDTTRLEAYSGYWVKVKKENVFLRFPADKQVARGLGARTLIADLFRTARDWLEQNLPAPKTAMADSGDSPPMPPAALGSATGSSSGSGGCFIHTAACEPKHR
jgi:uncharacterized repeat protein (TIGR02543 family)